MMMGTVVIVAIMLVVIAVNIEMVAATAKW